MSSTERPAVSTVLTRSARCELRAGDEHCFYFQLHSLHFRRVSIDDIIINLKREGDGVDYFFVCHITQTGFALSDESFYVVISDFSVSP